MIAILSLLHCTLGFIAKSESENEMGMRNLRTSCCVVSLVLPLMFAAGAAAKEFDADELAERISPYVERDTVVVAHLDLAEVDIDALAKMILQVALPQLPAAGEIEPQAQMAVAFAEGFKQQLKAAGATEVFALASMSDLMQNGVKLIIPIAQGGNHQQVASLVFSGRPDGPASRQQAMEQGVGVASPFEICSRVDDVVFCGTVKQHGSLPLSGQQRAHRATLTAALHQIGDSAAQVVVLTQEPFRVLRDMNPELPPELGDISGRELAEGVRWLAVGFQSPPEFNLRATIQSSDADSAQAVAKLIDATCKWLSDQPQVPREVVALLPATQRDGDRLITELDSEAFNMLGSAAFAAVVKPARMQARQNLSINRLKQLALAVWNFESTYGSFPPPVSYSDDDRPLLSWRVFLLPFLEEAELYEQFKLDEPWNSPHNRKLISKMPETFLSEGLDIQAEGKTGYLLPIADGTAFHGKLGTVVQQIKDGTSKTIMIAQAAPEHAVIWTKPDDWQVNLDQPSQGLTRAGQQKVIFAFCDGSVRTYELPIDAERLKRFLLRADGQPVE